VESRIYIETERLYVRQWEEEDLHPFYKLNSCPKVMRFYPNLLSRKESDNFVCKASSQIDENGYSFWAIELKESSKLIGTMGIADVYFKAHFTPAVEIGWRLDNKYWRRGLGYEGAKAILSYAFNTLMMKEVVSFTSSINTPSISLMEKIGMKKDIGGDFDHPNVDVNHPLRKHVLYRIGLDGII
tara:strand:+ start:2183 stop:2737 length:555 start_codon:yes stop_codon:yes gene_type:complete